MTNKYVLITPARNEEAYIEKTIRAVSTQNVLPLKWVIVSDRSIDRTDEIIKEYAAKYPFIEFERINEQSQWNFSSKVNAINSGLRKLVDLDYDFIGIVDADITFESDYYEQVLIKLKENERLGIAGGMIHELSDGKFKALNYNMNSVAGAVQLFRRKCFEEIGGYMPMELGGIDALAEIMSRMRGWEIKSFREINVYHHRIIGTTQTSLVRSRFRYGQRDYSFGTHPLFMLLKCIHRFWEQPYILGGFLMFCGYCWLWVRRKPRAVPDDIVRFLYKEQINRIISKFT